MTQLYVSLNHDFLEQTKLEANKAAVKEMGEPTKDYRWPDLDATCPEFGIEEGELHIAFDCDLGYFSFHYDLDKKDRIEMLEDSIRLINKFKAALEALK